MATAEGPIFIHDGVGIPPAVIAGMCIELADSAAGSRHRQRRGAVGVTMERTRFCRPETPPMSIRYVLAIVALALACASPALAQGLLQAGKSWVQLASSRDLNAAIGVARHFPGDPGARVVLASNGWYAVVIGPVAQNTIAAFKAADTYYDLPADAVIANGAGYVRTVWEPHSPILGEAEVGKPARAGDLTVTLSATKLGTDDATVRASGRDAKGTLFGIDVPAPDVTERFDTLNASIVRLDRSTRTPQVVVTGYTGGAHCCTETWILTEGPGGKWTTVPALTLDGGYQLEDLDNDGAAELVSTDDSFLYEFDAYAFSFAPVKITRLNAGALTDVTRTRPMRDRHAQEVALMEFQATQDPDLWHTNGFLAGWVAEKALVGELPDAWAKMLPLYERNASFGKQVCTTGFPIEKCPDNRLKTLPFPDGLALHLAENGYGPLPASLPGLTLPMPASR